MSAASRAVEAVLATEAPDAAVLSYRAMSAPQRALVDRHAATSGVSTSDFLRAADVARIRAVEASTAMAEIAAQARRGS